MIKKLILALLLAATLYVGLDYSQNTVFWKRFINTFAGDGEGAFSEVFDIQEAIAAADEPWDIPVAGDDTRRLDDEATEAMISFAEQFNSYSLLVIHDGEIQLEWYRDGYDRNTPTQSQSMHKSIQAMLIGVAIDQGLIASVDDPIGKYIEELAGDPRGEATIRNYLHMATGLRNFEPGINPFGGTFRWLYDPDIESATFEYPQVEPPGQRFDYNELNTQTLGILLTRVFGERYVGYLRRHIWNPMGGLEANVWLDREGGTPHHDCCLLGTTIDWAKVGLILKNDGEIRGQRVVSRNWVRDMAVPGLIPHYGYQTWIASNTDVNPRDTAGGYKRTEDWLADDVFYFSGYGAQRVYISRERDLVIVRMGPAAGYLQNIKNDWDNTFLFNEAVRSIERTAGN